MGGTVAYLIAEQQHGLTQELVLDVALPPSPIGGATPQRPGRLRKHVLNGSTPPPPIGRATPQRPYEEPADFDWAVVPAIFRQLNDPDPAWWDRLCEVTEPSPVVPGGAP